MASYQSDNQSETDSKTEIVIDADYISSDSANNSHDIVEEGGDNLQEWQHAVHHHHHHHHHHQHLHQHLHFDQQDLRYYTEDNSSSSSDSESVSESDNDVLMAHRVRRNVEELKKAKEKGILPSSTPTASSPGRGRRKKEETGTEEEG